MGVFTIKVLEVGEREGNRGILWGKETLAAKMPLHTCSGR